MKLTHTCINVRGMDESISFYCEKLGMKLLSRREIKENDAEIAYVMDGSSEHKIELTHWRAKKDYVEGDQLDHLAFEVEDLDRKINELRRLGVKIAREPFSLSGGSSRIAFITDPNGIWLELIEKK